MAAAREAIAATDDSPSPALSDIRVSDSGIGLSGPPTDNNNQYIIQNVARRPYKVRQADHQTLRAQT